MHSQYTDKLKKGYNNYEHHMTVT